MIPQAPPPDAAGEIVPLIMQDSEWRAAISQLFDDGFVEAGLRGEPDEWKAEFEVRTNILRAALNTPTDPLHSLSVGEEARRLRDLLARATPVRPGWNLRVKDNGEERYELIGDPCGFPVATFGDHNDAAFDDACRQHLPRLLDGIEAALSQSNAAQAGGERRFALLYQPPCGVWYIHSHKLYQSEELARLAAARFLHPDTPIAVLPVPADPLAALSQGSGSTDGAEALDPVDENLLRALSRNEEASEDAAWTWLESKYFNVEAGHDPNDRDYSADEMVDAFIAGGGRNGEVERLREALERLMQADESDWDAARDNAALALQPEQRG